MPQVMVWKCPKTGRLFEDGAEYIAYARARGAKRLREVRREVAMRNAQAELAARRDKIMSFDDLCEYMMSSGDLAHTAITGNVALKYTFRISACSVSAAKYYSAFPTDPYWTSDDLKSNASSAIRSHKDANLTQGWSLDFEISTKGQKPRQYDYLSRYLAAMGVFTGRAGRSDQLYAIIDDAIIPGITVLKRLAGEL